MKIMATYREGKSLVNMRLFTFTKRRIVPVSQTLGRM
jgi:hypothetical protein